MDVVDGSLSSCAASLSTQSSVFLQVNLDYSHSCTASGFLAQLDGQEQVLRAIEGWALLLS